MTLETAQKAVKDELARLKRDVEKLETALRHLSGTDGRPTESLPQAREKAKSGSSSYSHVARAARGTSALDHQAAPWDHPRRLAP